MLGVRFLPCGLSRFIRLPLHELTNQRISADEVTCFFDTSFAERLCEEDCLENRVKIIEQGQRQHETEQLDTQTRYNEYIITGLRTMWGISTEELKKKFGDRLWKYCLEQATIR